MIYLKRPLFLIIIVFLQRLKGEIPGSIECPSNLIEQCKCAKELGLLRIICKNVDKVSIFQDLFSSITNQMIDYLTVSCSESLKEFPILPKIHMKRIYIENCGFEELHGKVFNSVSENLEFLSLVNNSLKEIPVLEAMPRLESLNLNGNQISAVSDHVFDGLKRLKHLRLENNKICSLSKNALAEVKSTLEVLDLSINCFSSIPAQNLRNSMKLSHLDLSKNNISEVTPMSFMNLPSLKELKLSSNNLMKIAKNAFLNVPQLRILDLKENGLSYVDPSTIQAFKMLEMLDLSKNMLTKIPSLKEMSNLKQVRLDYNNFTGIETLTFSSNANLELINLQNNKISIIARNSFYSMDKLTTVLLANNSLPKLERSMLDGIPNLQIIDLHGNNISILANNTFMSSPKLTVLDLSGNDISTLGVGTFAKQNNLYWLDLSNNNLKNVEKGVFENKVANVLLDGNPLVCDEKINDFIYYLVVNEVRTFLPYQPEIKCAGPEAYVGIRLKELMIRMANETLPTLMQKRNKPKKNNILENLFPGFNLGAFQGFGNQQGASPNTNPLVNSIAQSLATQQSQNGQSLVVGKNGESLQQALQNPQLSPSDIAQILQTMPPMVITIPGLGNVDVSKLPPQLIQHVLQGGQLPGVPKETLDVIVKQYMAKIQAIAASRQQSPRLLLTSTTYPVGNYLPNNGLNRVSLKTHHIINTEMPLIDPTFAFPNNISSGLPNFQLSPQLLQMMKLIPPGYNLSNLPKEVIQPIMRGEMPDLSLLPIEILQHIREHSDELFQTFKSIKNVSLEDLLKKLPKFEHPQQSTFSPYDINKVDAGGIIMKEEDEERLFKTRLIASLVLGLVGVITVIILVLFCIYVRRNRLHAVPDAPSSNSMTPIDQINEEIKSRRTSTISGQTLRIDRAANIQQQNYPNPMDGYNPMDHIYHQNMTLYRI